MKNRSAFIVSKPAAVPCLLAVLALCGPVSGGDYYTDPRIKEWLKVCDPMQSPLPGEKSRATMEQVYYTP